MTTGPIVQGLYVNPTTVSVVMSFGDLAQILDDPEPDPRTGRKRGQPRLVTEREQRAIELREAVQRAFVGQKKANVRRYRDYIKNVIDGGVGDCPEITLWSEAELPLSHDSQNPYLVTIPMPGGFVLIAIDGETQVAGRFELLAQGHGTADRVRIVIKHGMPVDAARQIFHDRNLYGVGVPAAFAMSRDTRSPTSSLVHEIIPAFPAGVVSMNATSDPAKFSFFLLQQALLWNAIGRPAEVRRVPHNYGELLAEAAQHLKTRVPMLQPYFGERLMHRGAFFIAATDRRVELGHIEAVNWTSPEWGVFKATVTRKVIEGYVSRLRREVLDFETDTAGDALSL